MTSAMTSATDVNSKPVSLLNLLGVPCSRPSAAPHDSAMHLCSSSRAQARTNATPGLAPSDVHVLWVPGLRGPRPLGTVGRLGYERHESAEHCHFLVLRHWSTFNVFSHKGTLLFCGNVPCDNLPTKSMHDVSYGTRARTTKQLHFIFCVLDTKFVVFVWTGCFSLLNF